MIPHTHLIGLLVAAVIAPVYADESMPGMDHSKMSHEDMLKMQHKKSVHAHDHVTIAPVHAAEETMQGMDHSKMAYGDAHHHDHTASASAPTDARDPHAYSDSYGFGSEIAHSHKDEHPIAALVVDRLEGLGTGKYALMTYDWQAWFGKTFDRLVIRAEGNYDGKQASDGRNELLWGHALTPYWDTQLGVRIDTGKGANRSWFAFGLQGIAPYWLYIEATAYVGEQGRVAFRFESEYDLLITQRLILQPRIETNFYSKRDIGRGVIDSLSDFEGGLRLRYEIRREFAPYIGIEWSSAPDASGLTTQRIEATRWVAGVHFWY